MSDFILNGARKIQQTDLLTIFTYYSKEKNWETDNERNIKVTGCNRNKLEVLGQNRIVSLSDIYFS